MAKKSKRRQARRNRNKKQLSSDIQDASNVEQPAAANEARVEAAARVEVEEPPVSAAAQAMPASDIPLLFVWVLGIFIGLAVLIAPYGQTATGFNPDAHISGYFQTGSVLLLLLYFLFLMRKNNNCVVQIPRSPIALPIFLFVVWMAVSLVWAPSLYEGLIKLFDWLAAALTFLLVIMTVRDARSLRVLLFCLFMSGILISLLGILQYLFSVDWVHQHAAPAATFGNKNMAAQYMVATLPLGLCLLLTERNKLLTWLYSIGLVFPMTLLIYTHTRGSFVAFIIQFVLIMSLLALFKMKHKSSFYFSINKFASLAIAVAIFSVMVSFTPTTFSEGKLGIDKSVNPHGRTVQTQSFAQTVKYMTNFASTKAQRFTMWGNTFDLMKDHFWLGTGIGGWMVFYPKYQASYYPDPMLVDGYFHLNTHNDYLEIASELGVVGTALMLWILIAFFLYMWHLLYKPYPNKEIRTLVLAPMIAFLGISAAAFFSFPYQQAITIMLALVYMACITVADWQVQGHPKGPYCIKLPYFPARISVFVVLLILFVTTFSTHRRWHTAELAYRDAVASMRLNRLQDFGRLAKVAVEKNPLRKYTSYYLGNYYLGQKDYKNAIKQYERMYEDYPYRIEAMNNLGAAYIQTNQPLEAKRILELWATIQPHSLRAKIALGIFYYRVGKRAEAKQQFQSVLDRLGDGGLSQKHEAIRKRARQLLSAVDKPQHKLQIKR